MAESGDALNRAAQEHWGRLVSLLLARFRRLDLVEDAVADAFEAASRRWPAEGAPDNPGAWLHTVARRRVLDRLRAEVMARRKEPLLVVEAQRHVSTSLDGRSTSLDGRSASLEDAGWRDDPATDLLRLVLLCCHPALDPAAASALALRLVLGVPTHDIAQLFLVSDPTMSARLTRAKKKIVAAGIPFVVPDPDDLPDRLDTVAQIAYLAFTAGYAPGSGTEVVRTELAGEAIRLVELVLDLRPDEPVLVALLALMVLQHSRRDARVGAAGEIVLLPDQDRQRWHSGEITRGLALLRHPALSGPMTVPAASFCVQARIAACHASAPDPAATDWRRILGEYDLLLQLSPTPSVRLARTVALAEVSGAEAALTELEGIDIPGHRLPAVRAELLRRAGRPAKAVAAFDIAIGLCSNEAEAAHLRQQRAATVQTMTGGQTMTVGRE